MNNLTDGDGGNQAADDGACKSWCVTHHLSLDMSGRPTGGPGWCEGETINLVVAETEAEKPRVFLDYNPPGPEPEITLSGISGNPLSVQDAERLAFGLLAQVERARGHESLAVAYGALASSGDGAR